MQASLFEGKNYEYNNNGEKGYNENYKTKKNIQQTANLDTLNLDYTFKVL